MATVTTGAQVAARLEKAGGAIRKAQIKAVKLAALELKSSILAVSPARLRNVGKSGGRLGVSFTATSGANPAATGKGTGPWPIIEYDTKAHTIGPKRKRARSGRATVRIGSDFRASVHHPGTTGKMLFHKGTVAGTPKAVAIMHKTTVFAVKEALG